jgi:hypothetical protein
MAPRSPCSAPTADDSMAGPGCRSPRESNSTTRLARAAISCSLARTRERSLKQFLAGLKTAEYRGTALHELQSAARHLSGTSTAPGVVLALNGTDLLQLLQPVPEGQISMPSKWTSVVQHKFLNPREPLLAYDKVRHVGEAMTIVVRGEPRPGRRCGRTGHLGPRRVAGGGRTSAVPGLCSNCVNFAVPSAVSERGFRPRPSYGAAMAHFGIRDGNPAMLPAVGKDDQWEVGQN